MSKPKKLPVEELLRLACIYAEQDRLEFARANRTADPEQYSEAMDLVRQLREYRKKRWGGTKLEAALETGVSTPISDIREMIGALHGSPLDEQPQPPELGVLKGSPLDE